MKTFLEFIPFSAVSLYSNKRNVRGRKENTDVSDELLEILPRIVQKY